MSSKKSSRKTRGRSVRRSGQKSSRKKSPERHRVSSRGLKLVKIVKSPKREKKYRAVFSRDGRIKNVDFGASGYEDYLSHHDKERRERYKNRHRKRENWNKPDTAGSLSLHILWGESTSFRENVSKFKKRFHL